jgi:hypothetical protein
METGGAILLYLTSELCGGRSATVEGVSYILDWRSGGHQRLSGRCKEEKSFFGHVRNRTLVLRLLACCCTN